MKNKSLLAMRYLYLYGPCYKSDFTKLLEPQGSRSFDRLASEIRRKTGSDAFIEREIEVEGAKRQAHQTATIVALSPAGINFYKDREEDRFYRLTPRVPSFLLNTIQLKKYLWPHLTFQKAMILYRKADVNTMCYEKPSLDYLVYNLSDNAPGFAKRPYDRFCLDRYYESIGPEQRKRKLEAFLETGAYYSKQEVTAFFRMIGKNYADNIRGIDWQGIFLSKSSMFITFVLSYGENKRMYVPSEYLGNLISKLKQNLAIITDVYRRIADIGDSNGGRYDSRISAITIGIGSSHTCAEAMGNKYGRIRNRDMSLMESDARRYDIVDCTSKHFDRIYSIDDREQGIRMLNFLTHSTLESCHELELELFREDGRFSITKGSNLFPAVYEPLGVRAIYLPVYDIKLMRMIALRARKNIPVVICTERTMMETISHCVHIESVEDAEKKRVPGLWFIETREEGDSIRLGELVDENSGVFSIYDNKGYIRGRKMIDDWYLKQGYRLKSEGEYIRLARLCLPDREGASDFEMRTRFYNAVARSSVEQILKPYEPFIGTGEDAKVRLTETDPKKFERLPRLSRMVTCALPAKEKEELRRLAGSCGIAVSPLLRKTIRIVLNKTKQISRDRGISEKEALNAVFSIIGSEKDDNIDL